jgi:hypothetical protein
MQPIEQDYVHNRRQVMPLIESRRKPIMRPIEQSAGLNVAPIMRPIESSAEPKRKFVIKPT